MKRIMEVTIIWFYRKILGIAYTKRMRNEDVFKENINIKGPNVFNPRQLKFLVGTRKKRLGGSNIYSSFLSWR